MYTFQGKEKETVILALSGTSDGAIERACDTLNILNVAVIRAQRRVYVIGDRARWMAASGFVGDFGGLLVEGIDNATEMPMPPSDEPHDGRASRQEGQSHHGASLQRALARHGDPRMPVNRSRLVVRMGAKRPRS